VIGKIETIYLVAIYDPREIFEFKSEKDRAEFVKDLKGELLVDYLISQSSFYHYVIEESLLDKKFYDKEFWKGHYDNYLKEIEQAKWKGYVLSLEQFIDYQKEHKPNFLFVWWGKDDRDWFDDACDIHKVWCNHYGTHLKTKEETDKHFLGRYIQKTIPETKEERELFNAFEKLRLGK